MQTDLPDPVVYTNKCGIEAKSATNGADIFT